MKSARFILLAGLLLLAGCVAFDGDKFQVQLAQWVPLGTPLKQAEKTMRRHSFECDFIEGKHPLNDTGQDYLECQRIMFLMHDWHARIYFKDGKASGYGVVMVE